ncbi:hypothetical protein PYCC9005_002159 [Savitreella phatthalungensis]
MSAEALTARKPVPTWARAYPEPSQGAALVSAEQVYEMILESVDDEDTGFVIVDVRRTDFTETKCVRGAINIPAQSFYLGIETWAKVFGDRTVIFHCASSSSGGRGWRCAAWYQDHLDGLNLGSGFTGQSALLTGGIKRWIELYGEDSRVTIDVPELE